MTLQTYRSRTMTNSTALAVDTFTAKAPFKFYEGQIIVVSWGYNCTKINFFVVTRISKHNVWFKEISHSILDDEWGRQYCFQKGTCVPDVRTLDGKLVPINTGKEFRAKLKTWPDSGGQYCYKDSQLFSSEWDGKPIAYDHDT